jgi:hypothetical protein
MVSGREGQEKMIDFSKIEISDIGPCRSSEDSDRLARKQRRRERDRQAKERQRRQKGATLRSEYEAKSIARAKPWVAEGISRMTWYRRKAAKAADSPL